MFGHVCLQSRESGSSESFERTAQRLRERWIVEDEGEGECERAYPGVSPGNGTDGDGDGYDDGDGDEKEMEEETGWEELELDVVDNSGKSIGTLRVALESVSAFRTVHTEMQRAETGVQGQNKA